jgi:lipoprotein-anchoring transpeptidase ErfK/SrfK
MPDYYAILSRALQKGDFNSAHWRESVFEQTRHMLLAQLRAQQPPLSNTEIRLQTDALEASIKTIQSEFAPTGGGSRGPDRQRAMRPKTERRARSPMTAGGPGPKAAAFGLPPIVWVMSAIVIAAIAAGAYVLVASRHDNLAASRPENSVATRPENSVATRLENSVATRPGSEAPPASKSEAANDHPAAPQPTQAQHKARPAAVTVADGDLAPGIDGGSTEADVPFFFRRQPVFYRTTNPVGTIIIDKQQHFLYLIKPNQVALRYGIGVGKPCAGVAGLRKVASKVEWPQWQAPTEMVERKLAPPGVMKGGPGNPLGARLIALDDGSIRINGTNAPKTIGNSVNFGCIRLVNDDIVDLYNRVAIGAGVIFTD